MKITREIFDQQRSPRYGKTNPERMQYEFWEWMIRGEEIPPASADSSLEEQGVIVRNGYLKSTYGPWRARDQFQVPLNLEDGPIWNFDRMGRTQTELPDGRIICIAGEHEDHYDPDFCIYNDVVVFHPDDRIEIFGYPKEIFPPTDFHTATLFDDRIYIIGSVGYLGERRYGFTPVYALDLNDYHMTCIETSGEMPGWISQHEAVLDPDGAILIRGGCIDAGQPAFKNNMEEFALDFSTRIWRQLTRRNWSQFSIDVIKQPYSNTENIFEMVEELLPFQKYFSSLPGEGANLRWTEVEGVKVRIIDKYEGLDVIIEADLPGQQAQELAEKVRADVEKIIKRTCLLNTR